NGLVNVIAATLVGSGLPAPTLEGLQAQPTAPDASTTVPSTTVPSTTVPSVTVPSVTVPQLPSTSAPSGWPQPPAGARIRTARAAVVVLRPSRRSPWPVRRPFRFRCPEALSGDLFGVRGFCFAGGSLGRASDCSPVTASEGSEGPRSPKK